MNPKYWISREVFEWDVFPSSSKPLGPTFVERPYDYLMHAEKLLSTPGRARHRSSNEMMRRDTISNLKRSINHRLQSLDRLYGISSLPLNPKPKGLIDALERLGVIRPLLIRSLFELRNALEHRDGHPPGRPRCSELIDVTWYFLRSTDALVASSQLSMEFTKVTRSGKESPYVFTLDFSFGPELGLHFCGWFSQDLISQTARKGFSEATVVDIDGPEKWRRRKQHLDKRLSDKWVVGDFRIESFEAETCMRLALNPVRSG